MKPIEIAKGIYSVGALDWNIRDFHGYSTDYGTTYNAFLIVDEKIALIDTVKRPFFNTLLSNISEIVDPSKIDYVISNHTEMDHSGSLPPIMEAVGKDKPLYCSKMGEKNLKMHFSDNWNYKVVGSHDELSLGENTIHFLETKMLHWPDSMFSYLKEKQILFSSDAFGQHLAGTAFFDNEASEDIVMHQAKKYYANILLPYSALIQKLLNQVTDLGLKFKMICPDHGIIWLKNPLKIVKAYANWSKQIPKNKAVIVYDTMWNSTQTMAESIARGILEKGIQVQLMNLKNCHRSNIVTEIMDAAAVLIGTPTLNNEIYPTVSDFLTYLKGLKPQNKLSMSFGSYGWSGEAVKYADKRTEEMKFDKLKQGLKIQYVPNKENLKSCIELGSEIGEAILKKLG